MRQLIALDLPGGPGFVEALLRAWDDGDAVLPLDRRQPVGARERLLEAMAPAAVVDANGMRTALDGSRPMERDDALVMATSGSTGEPKGVVLTHRAVAASAAATSKRLGVSGGDHWLACLPLSHVGGLSVVTRALHTGTPLTVLDGFDPATVEQRAREGATLVSLVATALARIDASLFRTIVLGGSRAPSDLPANVVTTYGMTETGSGVVYDGVPLDGVEVRIDGDSGIHIRCPMLLRCYRDGTVPLDSDGWFETGDMGHWLPDGHLVVDGRRAEMIISGGENVWPVPLEQVLARAAGVADVMVVGAADPEWGERVVAVVVPADRTQPPTLDTLRAAVKAELPAFYAPRELRLVDEIPRTRLGKPLRRPQQK